MELYKFRLWCETEQTYVDMWAEDEPAQCPNNKDHIINSSLTTIMDKLGAIQPKD